MPSSNELLIMGFGGHARSIADIALACGYTQLFFLDDYAKEQEHFFNFPVTDKVSSKAWNCFVAAGNNSRRQMQMQEAQERGWIIESLFSPHATRGIGAQLGKGVLVGHHAHVGPMTIIGDGCIINNAAIVEHDCNIGKFTHVSVNATVSGGVVLGDDVLIGAGAVIRKGVSITDQVVIGAGATVIHDINEAGVYIGTPAKLMKKRLTDKPPIAGS